MEKKESEPREYRYFALIQKYEGRENMLLSKSEIVNNSQRSAKEGKIYYSAIYISCGDKAKFIVEDIVRICSPFGKILDIRGGDFACPLTLVLYDNTDKLLCDRSCSNAVQNLHLRKDKIKDKPINCAICLHPDLSVCQYSMLALSPIREIRFAKQLDNSLIAMNQPAKADLESLGLKVLYEFVSEQDEIDLLNEIDLPNTDTSHTDNNSNISTNSDHNISTEWEPLKLRLVKHFGLRFSYKLKRAVNLNESSNEELHRVGFPPTIGKIAERLTNELEESNNEQFDQCTANLYLPKTGIPPHVDTHEAFTNVLISLSLKDGIVMDFAKDETLKRNDENELDNFSVYLPRRSLLVMTNKGRYYYTHAIASRLHDYVVFDGSQEEYDQLLGSSIKNNDPINGDICHTKGLSCKIRRERETRVSLTFRKSRSGPCPCVWCESKVL